MSPEDLKRCVELLKELRFYDRKLIEIDNSNVVHIGKQETLKVVNVYSVSQSAYTPAIKSSPYSCKREFLDLKNAIKDVYINYRQITINKIKEIDPELVNGYL